MYECSPETTEPEDGNSIEEDQFYKLFVDTCDILQKIVPTERDLIDKAYMDIKASFTRYEFNSMNFGLPEYVFAYFEYYSKLNAAVSRHRFLNAMNNCRKLETYINRPELNVISLGGGQGADMVGFCSALQECRDEPIPFLSFCVVDQWKKFESFYDVVKLLLREKDYGAASRVFQKSNVCTSFMKVDLMDTNPPQKYNSAVRSADIVLLSRVLDSLTFNETRPEDMLNNIAQRMKKDALLLLVDSHPNMYNTDILQNIYDPVLETFTLKDERPGDANRSTTQIAVFVKTL